MIGPRKKRSTGMGRLSVCLGLLFVLLFLLFAGVRRIVPRQSGATEAVRLPTDKLLYLPVPGFPQRLNSFPTAVALSPDGRSPAILNNGYGTPQSDDSQSIAILDLKSGRLQGFPDRSAREEPHKVFVAS